MRDTNYIASRYSRGTPTPVWLSVANKGLTAIWCVSLANKGLTGALALHLQRTRNKVVGGRKPYNQLHLNTLQRFNRTDIGSGFSPCEEAKRRISLLQYPCPIYNTYALRHLVPRRML